MQGRDYLVVPVYCLVTVFGLVVLASAYLGAMYLIVLGLQKIIGALM